MVESYHVNAQALSPGESTLISPTALGGADKMISIGYGQVPNELAAQRIGDPETVEFYHEVYAYTAQFLPRLTLHLRNTFRNVKGEVNGEDRILGVRVLLTKQAGLLPAIAFGVRDVAGTRQRHAAYVVASEEIRTDRMVVKGSIGYAFHMFESTAYEMEEGVFSSVSLGIGGRLELIADYDTQDLYVGGRFWPTKWIWATGFVGLDDTSGFAFGISRVLPGGGKRRSD